MGVFGEEREEKEAYIYANIRTAQVKQKLTHLIVDIYYSMCGDGVEERGRLLVLYVFVFELFGKYSPINQHLSSFVI